MKVATYTLINEFLYNFGLDEIHWRCALKYEQKDIIDKAHSGPAGGHYQDDTTARKILQLGLWWPKINEYCRMHVSKCNKCQRMGWLFTRNEMPLISVNMSLTFEI